MLKMANNGGNLLPLANHIAGVVEEVNYSDDNSEADEEDEDFEDPENEDDESVYDPDQDFDNDKWFDVIQPSEIEDIKADWELAKQQNEARSVPKPKTVVEDDEDEDFYGTDTEEEPVVTRKSSREVLKPERYSAVQMNKDRRVSFPDQESHDMEQVHNLVSESKTKENTKE